jgi:hypothetical protein
MESCGKGHIRSPKRVSGRNDTSYIGPEIDHICKKGEMEESRRKLVSVTQRGV